MNRLAAAFSIRAQGVPFFHAGEELLRTKPDGKGGFDENSYRAPDEVNAIKWFDLAKDDHRITMEYYRGLIDLRKTYSCLRLCKREDVCNAVHPVPVDAPLGAAYHIAAEDQELFVIFNAACEVLTLQLPEGNWNVLVCDDKAGTQVLKQVSGTATALPISATVLTRA